MFAKLSALLLVLPFVSALTLNIPTNPTNAGTVTLTWTASTTDPASFSVELVNTIFHNSYAIANNVPTGDGTITVTLPEVPVGDGYSLEAVDVGNVNNVYSQTGDFSIGATTSATTTAASTTSSASSSSLSSTGTATSVSTTPLSSVSSVSSPSSSPTTATTSASSTPSTFNSGAASLKFVGVAPAAALILSAVAGAAMVF